MAAPVDPEAVGNAFLSYYYGNFESNRAGLVSLYQDQSMLTFMGEKFQGPQAIGQKLGALPFAGCKVTPSTTDFQPSVSGGVIVFVTGHILVRFASCLREGCAGGCADGTRARAGKTKTTLTLPSLTSSPQPQQTEGESQPLKFSQVFHLMPVGSSFVVTNGEEGGVSGQTPGRSRRRKRPDTPLSLTPPPSLLKPPPPTHTQTCSASTTAKEVSLRLFLSESGIEGEAEQQEDDARAPTRARLAPPSSEKKKTSETLLPQRRPL
jgi:hypothetical protein